MWSPRHQRPSREIFKNPSQSCDWEKYAQPEVTVSRARKPEEIKAIAFIAAGSCREEEQEVLHAPTGNEDPKGPNPAHSEIVGNKSDLVKTKLTNKLARVWMNPEFKQV